MRLPNNFGDEEPAKDPMTIWTLIICRGCAFQAEEPALLKFYYRNADISCQ